MCLLIGCVHESILENTLSDMPPPAESGDHHTQSLSMMASSSTPQSVDGLRSRALRGFAVPLCGGLGTRAPPAPTLPTSARKLRGTKDEGPRAPSARPFPQESAASSLSVSFSFSLPFAEDDGAWTGGAGRPLRVFPEPLNEGS